MRLRLCLLTLLAGLNLIAPPQVWAQVPCERELHEIQRQDPGILNDTKEMAADTLKSTDVAAINADIVEMEAGQLDPNNGTPYQGKYLLCISRLRLAQLSKAPAQPDGLSPLNPYASLSADQKSARFEEMVEGRKVDWDCQAYSCKGDMNQRFLQQYKRYQEIDCGKPYSQKECARHKVQEAQIRACISLCATKLECRRRNLTDDTCIDPFFK